MTNARDGGTVLPFSRWRPEIGKRPPLAVVLVAVLLLALGESAGAAMSQLRAPLQRWAISRVDAKPVAHGLSGSAEYDDEIRAQTVFLTEAGVSFFHTHAEGLGLVLLFTSSLVASVVGGRRQRGLLYLLLALGAFFPVGYLVYSVAVLELGRDVGVELAERWVLTTLGSLAILGLLGLGTALAAGRMRT